jgi:hypothetical protein
VLNKLHEIKNNVNIHETPGKSNGIAGLHEFFMLNTEDIAWANGSLSQFHHSISAIRRKLFLARKRIQNSLEIEAQNDK